MNDLTSGMDFERHYLGKLPSIGSTHYYKMGKLFSNVYVILVGAWVKIRLPVPSGSMLTILDIWVSVDLRNHLHC